MKKTIRTVLIIILALVFLTSAGMLLCQQIERREAQDIYARAQQIAVGERTAGASPRPTPAAAQPGQSAQPEQPEQTAQPTQSQQPQQSAQPQSTDPAAQPEQPLRDVNLTALRGVSGDVIGWISIPGTGLSYPLVQGEDNDYYLDHAWDGTPTAAGSIFMEYQCAADFTDFNTIIYGHRMTYDAMFAFLKYYKSLSYWEAHPLVYIKEAERTHCYEIFAAYEAPIRSLVYGLKLTDDNRRQEVIDYALEQSVIHTGVVPEPADRILTLSTCTGNGHETRWVVQAVEILQ